MSPETPTPTCPLPREPDESGIATLEIRPSSTLRDYRAALTLAEEATAARLGEAMLLSWYDRDRDFESPQHASECHRDSAVPGYVDYGIHHGATLKVVIEDGRFVFYFMPVAL